MCNAETIQNSFITYCQTQSVEDNSPLQKALRELIFHQTWDQCPIVFVLCLFEESPRRATWLYVGVCGVQKPPARMKSKITPVTPLCRNIRLGFQRQCRGEICDKETQKDGRSGRWPKQTSLFSRLMFLQKRNTRWSFFGMRKQQSSGPVFSSGTFSNSFE